jgi:uncharacterized membrane protein
MKTPWVVALLMAAPILILVLCVPLLMGKIPPNGFYGFRTPKTMSRPEIWYPANRMAAIDLMVAAVLMMAAFAVGMRCITNEVMLLRFITGAMLVCLFGAVAAAFLQLRKL